MPINTAVSQLQKDGVITIKEVKVPPIKDLYEVIDKDSYKLLPQDYQGQRQTFAQFKIKGKEYNVDSLYAIWYANLLDNVGEGNFTM